MLRHSILFLLVTLNLTSSAQKPVAGFFYNHTEKINYSLSNIRNILFDNNEFIWIATASGLHNFDGTAIHSIKNFVKQDKLCDGDIWEIRTDKIDQSIIFLNSFGRLCKYYYNKNQINEIIPKNENRKEEWYMSFEKYNKDIYVVGYRGLLYYDTALKKLIRPLPFTQYNTTSDDGHLSKKIKKDHNNNLWFIEKNIGLFIYSTQKKSLVKFIPIQALMPGNKNGIIANDFVAIGDSIMLITSDAGIMQIKYDATYNYTVLHNKLSEINVPVNAAVYDSKQLYFSSNDLFKYNFEDNALTVFFDNNSTEINDWKSSIGALTVHSGKLWLATGSQIYSLALSPPFLQPVKQDIKKKSLDHVYSIAPVGTNKSIVGTSHSVVLVTDNTQFTTLHDNVKGSYVFKINEGETIVSTENNLMLYTTGKLLPISSVYSEFKNYQTITLNSVVRLNASSFILGTENFAGILLWDRSGRKVTQIKPDDTNSSNVINTIRHINNKYFVVHDNSVSVYDHFFANPRHYSIKSKENEAIGILMDIDYAKGYYWVSAYNNGLIKLDTNFNLQQLYKTTDGLSDLGVYGINAVGDSCLYVSSNNGLSIFNLASNRFRNFYYGEGLHGNIFEENSSAKNDSNLFYGGANGYTIVTPLNFKRNLLPPKVYFYKVAFETDSKQADTMAFGLKFIEIPNNVLQTKVAVSGINWSNPERTTFQYRIIERSKGWIDLGTLNFITLIGLPPGTYHLQVKAANEDGVWSEPKELILVFLPKWYQTWWFYLLIVITVAGILYALYRYRIAQIKKQHEIRKNIATDLHDDLGSTLNSVKVFTNLAISGVKQEESLQQVKDNLTEATMSLRDMIWVLDDSLDTVDELVTRLKQFAIPVASASNIEAIIKADSEVNSRQLIKEEKRNLFLICKEAINNSIKYAAATQINVDIIASGKKIQIIVADNGKGFIMDEVKKGYGLKNMQYRAGQIKYKVALVSSPGKGTQIEIKPA